MHHAFVPCREDLHYFAGCLESLGAQEALYANMWIALLGDSPLGLKPIRVVRDFALDLKNDYSGLALRCAELGEDLMRSCFIGDDGVTIVGLDYMAFKGLPIQKEVIAYIQAPHAELFRYLLTFLWMGKRTPGLRTEEMEASALNDWLRVEDDLSRLNLNDELLSDISVCIAELFAPYFEHIPLPVHGSGSVAEKGVRTEAQKNEALCKLSCVEYVLSHFSSRVEVQKFMPEAYTYRPLTETSKTESRLKARMEFVDKTRWKLRSIGMEPAIYQMSQQSVRYSLEAAIEASPLGRFIRIHDQSYNAVAAIAASLLNHLDTSDLKDASNRLSLDVVRRTFPKKILAFLMNTRSSVMILPNGESHVLRKFAPMGSAVCFPTQSVFYCAVALVAYHYVAYASEQVSGPSLRRLLRIISDDPYEAVSGFYSLRVYGDDIISDGRVTPTIVEMLTSLGFVVNESKSFLGKQCFRESCGTYALQGVDVSPLTVKLAVKDAHMTPNLFSSLVALANRALELGYGSIRRYCLRLLHYLPSIKRGEIPRPLYYAAGHLEGEPYSENVQPRKVRPARFSGTSTNALFQREETRFIEVRTRVTEEPRDEVLSYNKWMRSPSNGDAGKPARSVRGSELRLQWAWLPT